MTRQRGRLLLITLPLLCALGLGIWLPLRHNPSAAEQRALHALYRAKEALIARAVSDLNRPGSLPCPDFATDSAALKNIPGDGKADNLTRNLCPSQVGWLPWITLDLPELQDESGNRLWYALHPDFRDDDNAPPINDRTQASLRLNQETGIAALIIAPGAALSGQSRQPSPALNAYLEGLDPADPMHFVQGSPANSNDRYLALRHSELHAALGKRIATSVQRCLSTHTHLNGITPWAVPLNASSPLATAGAWFGRLPTHSPGSGASQTLAQLEQTLSVPLPTQVSLETGQIVSRLLERSGELRAWNDQLHTLFSTLWQDSGALGQQLGKLVQSVDTATSNDRISATERTSLRSQALQTVNLLASLKIQLENNGIDSMPERIAVQTQAWQQAPTSALPALMDTLDLLNTPNPTLQQALNQARAAAQASLTAEQAGNSSPSQQAAIQAAREHLSSALADLQATQTRYGNGLNPNLFQRTPGLDSLLPLKSDEVLTLLESSIPIPDELRASYAHLLALASTYGNAPFPEPAALSELMQASHQLGENLTQTTLTQHSNTFQASQNTFATYTAPTQREMVPYATSLATDAEPLYRWALLLQAHSTRLATQIRAAPGTQTPQAGSLDALTQTFQTQLNAAQSAVEAALSSPGSATLKTKAEAALNTASASQQAVKTAVAEVRRNLTANRANALPILWRGSACAFLQDTTSWWYRNQWWDSLFFQFANLRPNAEAALKVNQHSTPLVAVAAGPAIGLQERRRNVLSDWLEGDNADASRNQDGIRPAPQFRQFPLSSTHNDQLAY